MHNMEIKVFEGGGMHNIEIKVFGGERRRYAQ